MSSFCYVFERIWAHGQLTFIDNIERVLRVRRLGKDAATTLDLPMLARTCMRKLAAIKKLRCLRLGMVTAKESKDLATSFSILLWFELFFAIALTSPGVFWVCWLAAGCIWSHVLLPLSQSRLGFSICVGCLGVPVLAYPLHVPLHMSQGDLWSDATWQQNKSSHTPQPLRWSPHPQTDG